MLSIKVIEFCKAKNWWYDDYTQQYATVLSNLSISLESDFAQFFLHIEDSATFYSNKNEMYQICWFVINSHYDLDIKRTHEILQLPVEYIPLDSFEGEGGFFYNRETEEVVELELGEKLQNFLSGKLKPQWKDFNSFLEWYFELSI